MVYYTTIGKILSFLNILVLPAYSVYNAIVTVSDDANKMGITLVLLFFFSGVVLGLVEVPMLCSCYDFCKVIAKYTRVLGGFWVARAGVNIGLASGLLALVAHKISTQKRENPATPFTNPYVIIIPVSMLIVGVLYLLGALWKREPPPGGEKPQAGETEFKGSSGSDSGGVAASAGGFLGGFFARKVMENPEGAASLMKSAGPSLASTMFGGSGGSSSTSGSSSSSSSSSMFGGSKDSGEGGSGSGKSSPKDATGFYGDEESGKKKDEKVSMFSGGGLFGGSSSSGNTDKAALYGVATDEDAAANPFISSL